MGRVPQLVMSLIVFGLIACDAEPPSSAASERAESAVRDAGNAARDAGDAAREAVEKASEVLRKLGAAAVAAGESATTQARPEAAPEAPVKEAPIVKVEPEGDERDASVAAAEAKDKVIEVTKRAVESVRAVGQGVVDAISDDSKAPAAE